MAQNSKENGKCMYHLTYNKVTGNITSVHAINAHRGNGFIAPLLLNLKKVKVKQSHYTPREAQKVPGG